MEPINVFKAEVKQYITDMLKDCDEQLKERLDVVYKMLVSIIEDEVKAYFNECIAATTIDFVTFERWGPNITLTASRPKLKVECKAWVEKIDSDMVLIDMQENEEKKAEIFIEYQKTLNAAQAVKTVEERWNAKEEQKRKREEAKLRKAAEAEAVKKVEAAVPAVPSTPVLEPPKVKTETPAPTDDPIKTLSFKVTAPVSKLRELKKFLDENEYQYS